MVPNNNNDDNNECHDIFISEDCFVNSPDSQINTLGNVAPRCTWTEDACKKLLELYKNYYRVKSSRKKKMENISREMSKFGFIYSATQIDSKLKYLEQTYKNKLLNKKRTGRGRLDMKFEQ